MRFKLGQFHYRSAMVLLLFYGLILALVMQTIRAERLEAELRARAAEHQAALAQAIQAEQSARVGAEMMLQKIQANAELTQKAQNRGPIPD